MLAAIATVSAHQVLAARNTLAAVAALARVALHIAMADTVRAVGRRRGVRVAVPAPARGLLLVMEEVGPDVDSTGGVVAADVLPVGCPAAGVGEEPAPVGPVLQEPADLREPWPDNARALP